MDVRLGLRGRLVALVVAAVLPLFGLSLFSAWRDAQAARDAARDNLRFAASLAASSQTQAAESVRSLLTAVANVPGLHEADDAQCRAYFEALHVRLPGYVNFGVLDPQGHVRCHGREARDEVGAADRSYFRDAVAGKGFAISDFMVGRLSGKPVQIFALPILDPQGAALGVAFASLPLETLLHGGQGLALPAGARLTLMDRHGTVLVSEPAGTVQPGRTVPDAALREAVRAGKETVVEAPDAEGRSRIYAFAPATGAARGAVFASVSMDSDQVLAPLRWSLVVQMAALLAVALLGGWAAWSIGGRGIVEPARRLLDAARMLEKGYFAERVPVVPGTQAEFARIASAFNLMAESLELRQREGDAQGERSRRAFEILDLVVNSLQEGLIAADREGNFLMFNSAAARVFPQGTQQEAVAPSEWARVFGVYEPAGDRLCSPDDMPLYRAIQGKYGSMRDILVRNERVPHGKVLRCHYRPMLSDGEVVGGLVIFTDLTGMQKLEEARARDDEKLREIHGKLVAAQRIGRMGHWEMDLATNRLWWSDEVHELFGVSHIEFPGTLAAFIELVHPDDRAALEEAQAAAMRSGLMDATYRIVTPGGQVRWMQERAEVRTDAQGAPRVLAGVVQDVTARMKAEQELHGNMQQLKRAAEAAQRITAQRTLQGMLQEVVDQAREVIGAHQAVVSLSTGHGWAQNINALSLSGKYAAYRSKMADFEPDGTGIYALVCETNRPLRLTQAQLEAHPRWQGFGHYSAQHPPMRGWMAVPLTGRDGQNTGLLQLSDRYEGEFTAHDEYIAIEIAQLASIAVENGRLFDEVNDLNATLEAKVATRTADLARQEARFRALAEQAPEVVWNIDPEGGLIYVNHAWHDLVGGPPDGWQGSGWLSALHPADRAPVAAIWEKAKEQGLPFSGIRRIRARDGTYHTMSYRGAPVRGPDGKVEFWVGVDADISEIKAIEDALRRSNEELEAFSYSVSHDLRAPLSTVDGFSRLLARQLEGESAGKAAPYLERIQIAAAQMGQLIEALLSLAQVTRAKLAHEAVDVSRLSADILAILRSRDPSRHVETIVQPGIITHGDPRLVRVMMENLLGNAWKFTAREGSALIEVGRNTGEEDVFFVRDNGVGFDMAHAGKLFGAFQRLHSPDDFPGTGIGLATVGRVVARHGGTIRAEARPGHGASFFICLPRTPPAAWAAELPAP
jgi:PAS domain S-box-containing protein